MAKISKIKLGNTTYDIRDALAFKGAELSTTLITSGNSTYTVSNLVFLDDSNPSNTLDSVNFNTLQTGALSSLVISSPAIISQIIQLDNPSDNIEDSINISTAKNDGIPSIILSGTTDGTISGDPVNIIIPFNKDGEIAFLSDVEELGENKFGYVIKQTMGGSGGQHNYTLLLFFTEPPTQSQTGLIQAGESPIGTVNLDNILVLSINAGEVKTGNVGFNVSSTYSSTYTQIKPEVVSNKDLYTFTVGNNSVSHTVKLPMDADGTIALTSDLTSLQNAIGDINDVLDLNGEDVTTTIDTFNEVKEFLEDYSTSDDLASLLAGKIEGITYDESGSSPVLKYTKTSGGSATSVVTLDTTPTSGSKKPITSGAVYTLDLAVVKKIELNGKESTPSSGKVTLQDVVTKIQLNGKDQTLSKTASTGEGKINLTSVVTNITMNGTAVSGTENTTNGTYTVALSETDPVFSASAAAGITSSDISNWNNAASGGVTNVSFTTSGSGNSTKYLIQKTIGGTTTSVVELPTATYDSTNETLELILATAPSSK